MKYDELISREQAIDALDGVKVDEKNRDEYDIGYNDGINFAISKLSVLPTAQPEQPEQHWIPVKERNPIEYYNPIEFMATLEDPSGERYVEFIEWDGYKWDDFYTDDNERGVWGYDKVIAWMRKPKPWEGDAE